MVRKKLQPLSALSVLALAACATPATQPLRASGDCDGSADAHRQIVVDFYNLGLVGRRPSSAFQRHMSAQFIEHKPDVPLGTREATAAFLEQLMANLPRARWEILRTVAEGNLVFLHAKFTPDVGAPAYAIADLFRLEHCRIVEHWDVVAPPPAEQRNPYPRF